LSSDNVQRRELWRHGRSPGDPESAIDAVVVEAPLELRVAGQAAVVVMRTPGNDEELALGLAITGGWLQPTDPLRVTRVPDDVLPAEERGNVVEIALPGPRPAPRTLVSSSSCGICGKTAIAELEVRAAAIASRFEVDASLVAALPERMRAEQGVFEHTGGVHAAGLFAADGEILCVREDVGRHNAVDKVVGWAAREGRLPLGEALLCVSGRVSFEIMQKAVVAGVPVVVAVSAPSSLAIDVAERFRVTMCGFVRGGEFNVYAHAMRIRGR